LLSLQSTSSEGIEMAIKLFPFIHQEKQRFSRETYLSQKFLEGTCKKIEEIRSQSNHLTTVEDAALSIASQEVFNECNKLIEQIDPSLFSFKEEYDNLVKKLRIDYAMTYLNKLEQAIIEFYNKN
jgi:hypothetical protein